MIQIDKVEISYFRSIYSLKLSGLSDLSVVSGKNDCGKSNVLKALNLFFNNETDWQTALDFQVDFSKRRLNEVRKETIKGKQFIRVSVHFIRGKRSVKSLPDKFTVTKTWYRNSSTPEIKTSIARQFNQGKIRSTSLHRANAGLQNYLNLIRYEYIPAIKDRDFFQYSLGILQDTILENRTSGTVEEAVNNLNMTVEVGTTELNEEFSEVCGVKTDIKLPQDLASLFRAFSVATRYGEDDVPLSKRGDGIQTRFIPSLLYHISENSRLTYIWGFEEPENCLEHALASDLAANIYDEYCKNNQIIISSHSPAFLGLEGERIVKYRVFTASKATNAIQIYPQTKSSKDYPEDELQEELGLLQLASEQQKVYVIKKAELETQMSAVSELSTIYEENNRPILLTEGRSDPLILKAAWGKLYPTEAIPFRIISCNTLPTYSGEAAGASMLKIALDSCRPDHPITIGLFDYDKEGIKQYEALGNNYELMKPDKIVKKHKNGKGFAFCIPEIAGKEEYRTAKNLPIEFVLPDDYIVKKNDVGVGLRLEQEKVVTMVKGDTIDTSLTTEPHFRKIIGNKVRFAEEVITGFEQEAFANFDCIFELVKEILHNQEA